jgi:DNA polymerase III sliding clamp (beta) subunit (PCNA family)
MHLNKFLTQIPRMVGRSSSELRALEVQVTLSPEGHCAVESKEFLIEATVSGLSGQKPCSYSFADVLDIARNRSPQTWQSHFIEYDNFEQQIEASAKKKLFSLGEELFSFSEKGYAVFRQLNKLFTFTREEKARQYASYVALFWEGDHLRAEATNGHYMAWYESPELAKASAKRSWALHRKSAWALAYWGQLEKIIWYEKALCVESNEIKASYRLKQLAATIGDSTDEDCVHFPSTAQILLPPEQIKTTIRFSAESSLILLDYAKELQKEAGEKKADALQITVSKEHLTLKLVAKERALRPKLEGEPMSLGISPKYFTEALSIFENGLSIYLAGPLMPIQFETIVHDLESLEERGSWLVVVMPMRL